MECFLVAGLTQWLCTRDIQIHDNRILPTSYDHRLTRHVWAGIDFLMGYVRRNVDEISSIGLIAELQPITPPHACTTSDDIDHCFQFSMMVGTSFGVRLDHYCTCPQLTCPSTRMRDSCGPCHSRRLSCICVQLPHVPDPYTVLFPVHRLSTSARLRSQSSLPAAFRILARTNSKSANRRAVLL